MFCGFQCIQIAWFSIVCVIMNNLIENNYTQMHINASLGRTITKGVRFIIKISLPINASIILYHIE